jgi:glycosyltransferase involved in cell wall biosynthesis
MWLNQTVSVALPTYNERDSIRECIEGFLATGVVDEVVVCNNNAAAGTSEQVALTSAREVFETRQGYGWSCRKALSEARGDLVVLCEPDGSFEPADIFKLLAYSADYDVVLGSRTNSEFIWSGAKMGFLLKWGNWAVAKYLEFLFNTTSLTDVGCTMRLTRRRALDAITPRFSVGRSHFGPEMTLLCLQAGARVGEIPLNYKPRVGASMGTPTLGSASRVGVRMVAFITGFRLRTWFAGRPAPSASAEARDPLRHGRG